MSTTETPTLLKVHEAAELLRVGRATAYRLVKSGELPAVKVGGSYRIDRAELDEYIYGTPGEDE